MIEDIIDTDNKPTNDNTKSLPMSASIELQELNEKVNSKMNIGQSFIESANGKRDRSYLCQICGK